MIKEKGWYLAFKYLDTLREPGQQIVTEWLKLDANDELEASGKAVERLKVINDQIKAGIGKYATKKGGIARGIIEPTLVFVKAM